MDIQNIRLSGRMDKRFNDVIKWSVSVFKVLVLGPYLISGRISRAAVGIEAAHTPHVWLSYVAFSAEFSDYDVWRRVDSVA